jgi:hypothetical protein
MKARSVSGLSEYLIANLITFGFASGQRSTVDRMLRDPGSSVIDLLDEGRLGLAHQDVHWPVACGSEGQQ